MTSPAEKLTWSTEQRNPETFDIDTLDSAGIVNAIISADAVVVAAVKAVDEQLAVAVDLAVAAVSAGGRIHYVGAGTSGRLGVLDAVELYPTYRVGDETVVAHLAGGLDAMMRAAEGAEDDAEAGRALDLRPQDLVVGIAASGRTPFVRGAMEAALEAGLATVLISSNPNAPLAELATVAILPDTGPEVVTGSTRMKAATAQKLILNTFSTATMIRLGKTYSNLMINVVATNAKLERRMVQLIEQATGLPAEESAGLLAKADGDLRLAIVAGLADVTPQIAADVLDELPADPRRVGDPAGVRTAVSRLKSAAAN